MTTHDLAKVDQYDPAQRRALTRTPYSPVMILLTILATAGVLAYAGFLFNPANRGDILPYLLVIGAESILILHALLAMWTVLAGFRSPRTAAYWAAQRALFRGRVVTSTHRPNARWPLEIDGRPVTVAVLITCYGEPLEVIRRTASAGALAVNSPNSSANQQIATAASRRLRTTRRAGAPDSGITAATASAASAAAVGTSLTNSTRIMGGNTASSFITGLSAAAGTLVVAPLLAAVAAIIAHPPPGPSPAAACCTRPAGLPCAPASLRAAAAAPPQRAPPHR